MSKKPERVIQSEVMLAASNQGYTLWRNNTGSAWQGKRTNADRATLILPGGTKRILDRAIVLENPRPVSFGLCDGSSDLIGLKRVTITPDMVGQTVAQFTAIEVKSRTGRVSGAQHHFIAFVERAGGLAQVARDPGDIPE